jgi:hypothetical protein
MSCTCAIKDCAPNCSFDQCDAFCTGSSCDESFANFFSVRVLQLSLGIVFALLAAVSLFLLVRLPRSRPTMQHYCLIFLFMSSAIRCVSVTALFRLEPRCCVPRLISGIPIFLTFCALSYAILFWFETGKTNVAFMKRGKVLLFAMMAFVAVGNVAGAVLTCVMENSVDSIVIDDAINGAFALILWVLFVIVSRNLLTQRDERRKSENVSRAPFNVLRPLYVLETRMISLSFAFLFLTPAYLGLLAVYIYFNAYHDVLWFIIGRSVFGGIDAFLQLLTILLFKPIPLTEEMRKHLLT